LLRDLTLTVTAHDLLYKAWADRDPAYAYVVECSNASYIQTYATELEICKYA